MINHVGILLNTKKHIRAYLLNNFGEKPVFDNKHIFHDFLLLCLSHQLTFNANNFIEYPDTCKIYVTKNDYDRYGCWLNLVQTHYFNMHVDSYMKALLVSYTDSYLSLSQNKKLISALEFSLDVLKVTDNDWSVESVTRYYHRHRKRTNKPLLYNKTLRKL